MSRAGPSSSHNPSVSSCDNRAISYVWRHNVATEFQKFVDATERYKIISFDTEFPGSLPRPPTSIFAPQKPNDPRGFLHMQYNITALKIVQLGVSVCDESGEKPERHTWQFNFHFDLRCDNKQSYGIRMLKNAGVDFERHKKSGIDANRFFENLNQCGLLRTCRVRWVCFHGLYDVGYVTTPGNGRSNPPA